MNFLKHSNFQNDILLIMIGIVGALGAISMIYIDPNLGTQKYGIQNSYDISVKKSQILAMVGRRDYLTQNERDAILKELIGEKIKKYNFSQEEVSEILNVLNKK